MKEIYTLEIEKDSVEPVEKNRCPECNGFLIGNKCLKCKIEIIKK